jgi:LPS sulfotransferase NodH
VSVKVYFYKYDIGKVSLVWGVNDWKAVPEAYWPENTTLDEKGVLWTDMKEVGPYFFADLQIPVGSDLKYGFHIAETRAGFPLTHWTLPIRFNSVTVYEKRFKHLIKFFLWNIIQISQMLYWKTRINRFEYVESIRWRKTNYTRFIVLAGARTGSTMLVTMLQSHPNVKMYGELFHVKKAKQITSTPNRHNLNRATVEFLNQHVYKPYIGLVRAVGFKLLYGHDKRIWRFVWLYLQKSGVRIIHLKRRNLLARYLSFELAKRSNLWIASENNVDNLKYEEPIIIDPKSCINNIKQMVHRQAKYEEVFTNNPMIETVYEDLVANTRDECARLLKFLGLAEHDLSNQSLRKQRTKRLSEVIANYNELKFAFEDGVKSGEVKPEWLSFFDE